jgi:hypothetical protein
MGQSARTESQPLRRMPRAWAYHDRVNFPAQISVGQYSVRMCWFVAIGWALIAVKCSLVWWAMVHWSVPFHPMWIVGPTLMFALLVTALWLTHHED